jgi:two-component system, OmpR family, response regulator RegX3
MSERRRTILLVEDEKSITAPLSEALTREGWDLELAETAQAARELAAGVDPDLILLDVMLPDGSGFDVCREIRSGSAVPIIMLTARGDEADRVAGLEMGADDYVVKPFSAREVVARIRAVLRRSADGPAQPSSTEQLQVGAITLDPGSRTVTRGGEQVETTRKEFDLLQLLMLNAGTVVTRDRLIDEVWDMNWFGSTKTLDVHISALRKKLGDDGARHIQTVRGVGFRFARDGESDR